MLLSSLSIDEKFAFAALAKKLIAADGVFDSREMQMYAEICKEMELPKNCDIPTDKTTEELAKIFINKQNKIFALLEFYSLALCDEDFDDSEKKLINKIANIFECKREILPQMERWAKKRISLILDIKKLLEEI